MSSQEKTIKVFLDSAREVLSQMAMLELDVEEVAPSADLPETLDLSASMGLCGDRFEGVMLITLSEVLACKVVAAMLGMEESEVEDDLLDGVCEIANMVAGSAKTALTDEPEHFDLSIPTAMRGAKSAVSPKAQSDGWVATCRVEGEILKIALWMEERSKG